MKLIQLTFLFFITSFLCAQNTEVRYLSGTGADKTVNWEFFCSAGMNSGKWTTIAVPSCWEQQGFGAYNYGHDKFETRLNETGTYRHSFAVPADWKNKQVNIVFDGVMTDALVKVNGKQAGPVHQGAFYQFKYDISKLIKIGSKNILEVNVKKMSAEKSIALAEGSGDYWVFGGIFRPVYLEAFPKSFIERLAIDAKADGNFLMDVFIVNANSTNEVEAQVYTLKGEKIGEPLKIKTAQKQEKVTLTGKFSHPDSWNCEFPNLYEIKVSIKGKYGIIHQITQKFGFRTVEVRLRDGIYVNGKRVILKGVCRHSFYPKTGRTLSKELSITAVSLMKEMNMNAVRMSHYPPDTHFLDVCDSLGLFVLDELPGWQASYDTVPGKKLVKEMVLRDVNHPSIIFWDNGNEGGWNRELDDEFAKYDPQKRIVLHPWEKFNGFDTKHYPDYNYVVNSTLYGQEIFMPTEFMHGLYDGGHGAGLDDFWNLMLQHPYLGGGFLWAFADEGVVRTDKNSFIDTKTNQAPDGILGPYNEKEASFYTIKEIWSPIYISKKAISASFNGILEVENRYCYTNLDKCTFEWKLVTCPSSKDKSFNLTINSSGNSRTLQLEPGLKGLLYLNLPANWTESDALYLTAIDQYKHEIFTWTWAIKSPAEIAKREIVSSISSKIETNETDSTLIVKVADVVYYFHKLTGFLEKLKNSKSELSLSGGPVPINKKIKLENFSHYFQGENYIVEPLYSDESSFKVKWTISPDKPAKLEYEYVYNGEQNCMGLTFNYPEEEITGLKWMGRGPYRIWKNRLKGMQWGVWQKDYNNTITGETWLYPEFKGFYSEVYWVTIENKQTPFTVYSETEGLFVQMLKPEKPKGSNNDNTSPEFPQGNLGFLSAIIPIGTKFQAPNLIGPQSQKNIQLNYSPIKGSLWFDFRNNDSNLINSY